MPGSRLHGSTLWGRDKSAEPQPETAEFRSSTTKWDCQGASIETAPAEPRPGGDQRNWPEVPLGFRWHRQARAGRSPKFATARWRHPESWLRAGSSSATAQWADRPSSQRNGRACFPAGAARFETLQTNSASLARFGFAHGL